VLTDFGILSAHFDVIAYIAESVFKGIRHDCTNALKKSKDGVNENELQVKIDEDLKKYHRLLLSFLHRLNNKSFDSSFYLEVRNAINEFVKKKPSSKLLKEYLEKSGRRCFATFVKSKTLEKYISFSGFLDCEDVVILKWRGERRAPFVDVAKEICIDCGATLVQTNQNIRLYCDSCHKGLFNNLSLGQVIKMGIKVNEKNFACSERKIFGYFWDKTPSGSLYVKFKMCCMCNQGYSFQKNNRNVKINVYQGIK